MEIRNRIIHAELPRILLMYSAYVTVNFVNSQSALFPNHLLYRKLTYSIPGVSLTVTSPDIALCSLDIYFVGVL